MYMCKYIISPLHQASSLLHRPSSWWY